MSIRQLGFALATATFVSLLSQVAPISQAFAQSQDEILSDSFLTAPIEGQGSANQAKLSPDNVGTITRIEKYLNKLRTLRARFVQVSSTGNFAQGSVYLQRPGKMRFEYDSPNPVLLIADGTSLLYYDRDLKNANFIPIEDTPLWLLVQPQVSVTNGMNVVELIEENLTISLTVEFEGKSDAGNITLVFSDQPLELKKWIVNDAQGVAIQVALQDVEYDVPLARELFQYGDLDVYGVDDNLGR